MIGDSEFTKREASNLSRLAGGVRKQIVGLGEQISSEERHALGRAAAILEDFASTKRAAGRNQKQKEEQDQRAREERYIARAREFTRGLTTVEAIERCEALVDYLHKADYSGFGPFVELSTWARGAVLERAPEWRQYLSLALGEVLYDLDRPGALRATLQGFMAFLPEWREGREREAVIAASPNVVRLGKKA